MGGTAGAGGAGMGVRGNGPDCAAGHSGMYYSLASDLIAYVSL